MVTLTDIANRVGVTAATVSAVLNHSRSNIKISEPTRRKIQAAALELNYVPSFAAQALAKGKTFSIGFLCGNIHSPHYSELASLALREVETRGYHLLVTLTEWRTQEDDNACLESLLRRGIDGVLYWSFGLTENSPLKRGLLERKFPVVTMTRHIQGFSSIISDWRPGIDQALEHLAGKGHREICFVTGPLVQNWPYSKKAALDETCARLGLALREYRVNEPSCLEASEELGCRLGAGSDRPKAIVAASDQIATGLMRGLRAAGLEIPRDVALVGMDGTQMGKYLFPSLTSIAQDRRRTITEGVDLLISMIDGKESPGRQVVLPTWLEIGGST